MASHDGSSPLALKNITGICSILTSAGFRASDWEGLASQLRINDPGRIKVMHPQRPALCLEETIRQWLNEDTETSWEKLSTAVSQVEGYGKGTKQKILPRGALQDTFPSGAERASPSSISAIPQSGLPDTPNYERQSGEGPPEQQLRRTCYTPQEIITDQGHEQGKECLGAEECGTTYSHIVHRPIKRRLSLDSDADNELESPAKRPQGILQDTFPSDAVGRMGSSSVSATPLSALPGTPNNQQRDAHELEDEIHELEGHFFKVVDKTTNRLQKTPNGLPNLKTCLIQLPVSMKRQHVKFFSENALAIGKAESIEEIFIILALYWDYLNCGLLELIVNKFGDEDIKTEMKKYLQSLSKFRHRTKVRDYIDKWMHGWPPGFTELSIEMKEEWMDRTLEDLEKLRLDVSRKCSFDPYTVLIKEAKPGCLSVSFALHSFPIQSEILPSLQELLCNQGVLKILLCGVPSKAIHPHQPSLKDPQVDSNSCQTKGDDTTMEGKVDYCEKSSAKQPPDMITTVSEKSTQTEKDSTATVQLQGRLSATEAILKLERKRKEELQQQIVESEWQAKQAKVKLEEAELFNKQLLTEKDQLTAGIEQREAQMEWERKDKETTVRSFREREEVAVQRKLELQKQMDELTKQYETHTEKLAAKDGQLRKHFESYQRLQSELQSKEQLIEQLQADYESLKSQYTELQASYREVEDKSEHTKSSSARQDPQQTELVTDLLSQVQQLQLEKEELLARPQEQKTHPPLGQKDVETTEEYDKLGEIQEKRPELELKGDSQPGQVTGNENQAEVYLQSKDEGQLDSRSLKQLLEIERKGKEALLKKLQESEWRANQLSDRVVYEEKRANDLVRKQEDQSAILQLTETQLQWEREKREAQEKNSVQLQLRMKELEFLAVKESHKKPFPSEPHHRAQLQSLREESKVLEQQQQLLEETASAAAEGQELQQRPSWFQQLEGNELWLHDVRVSDEEASTIAKNLREKKNLETLTLERVKVSDSGLCAIVGALRDNNSLKTFDLSWIQIPDQVAHALGGALRVNTVLQELILWNVEVSDEGMSAIAGALHVNRNLMKLDLLATGVTDEGCSAIASALTVNTSLRSLNLDGTKITDRGAHALGEALRVNQGLQELGLYYTGVTDEGCSAIASALTINTSLSSLKLSHTKVSDDGVRALGEALHVNQSLQTLQIDFAKVSDGAASEFVAAIEVNSSLKKLIVWRTSNTSKEVMKRIKEITTRKSIELLIF